LGLKISLNSSCVAGPFRASGTLLETLAKERIKEASSPIKPHLGQHNKGGGGEGGEGEGITT